MDFELAVWEMTHLLIAPKKVFRNMFYHKQTKNTYHRADPSFTYLLAFFLLLTSLAWGLAYADGFPQTIRLTLVFVFGHFIGLSLLVSSAAFFLVGRLLGPGGLQSFPGRRKGLFQHLAQPATGEGDGLEFGYCFDVSGVAFSPTK